VKATEYEDWRITNWKGFGRKRLWSKRGTFLQFASRYWRKPRRPSVRRVGVLDGTPLEHLQNTSLERYHCVGLPPVWEFCIRFSRILNVTSRCLGYTHGRMYTLFNTVHIWWSWESSVTRLRARRQTNCRRQESFLFSQRLDRLWGPLSLLPIKTRGSFSGGKAADAWSWPLISLYSQG
jgi:hypothetical protein